MPQSKTSLSIITRQDAADTLLNPMTLRQLEPFIGQDKTIKDAAQETGAKANTVLARVRRFLDLGLLKISEELPRKGRALKVYRSSADVFFVPYEATSAETLLSMMSERDAYWEASLRQAVVKSRSDDIGSWGTRIYRDDRGRLQVQAAVNPEHNHTMLDANRPAALSAWRDSVYLDFEDAKALQREMFALLQRYHQKQGAQRYIVHLGMAPISETP